MNFFLPERADTGRYEKELIVNNTVPTRALPAHPNLDQLRHQPKDLLSAFTARGEAAISEVNEHYRDASPSTFALHDAQLVQARTYGFESWPKLKAHVDGVTLQRLCDAVRRQDLEQTRAILRVPDELANRALTDGHTALHYVVLVRSPEIVRLLLEHAADPNQSIWPHREATTPFIMARERGYEAEDLTSACAACSR
jgi:hypothetical protein